MLPIYELVYNYTGSLFYHGQQKLKIDSLNRSALSECTNPFVPSIMLFSLFLTNNNYCYIEQLNGGSRGGGGASVRPPP